MVSITLQETTIDFESYKISFVRYTQEYVKVLLRYLYDTKAIGVRSKLTLTKLLFRLFRALQHTIPIKKVAHHRAMQLLYYHV